MNVARSSAVLPNRARPRRRPRVSIWRAWGIENEDEDRFAEDEHDGLGFLDLDLADVQFDGHRLAQEFFAFAPPETLQVKRKQEPIDAFQLLRPTEVDTRIGASVARGLTRFVGRSREIETLREAFAKVQSGEGQVMGLVGVGVLPDGTNQDRSGTNREGAQNAH